MNKQSIKELARKYEDLSFQIEIAWMRALGYDRGCLYAWDMVDDNSIRIMYSTPEGVIQFDVLSVDEVIRSINGE